MLSDYFWKRLSHAAGLLSISGICAVLILMANVEIKDLDLWLHMAMGRFIVENGYVPQVDVLSCTIAGKPWVNHEWLFQVIAYAANQWRGPEGLILLQVIIVVLTLILLLLLAYNKNNQLATIVPFFLVLFVYRDRFTIRPDLFSLFFLAFFLYILFYHIHRRWAWFALFIMQIAWANIHGFFILGPLVVLLLIVSQWLKRRAPLVYHWNQVDRLEDQEYRSLKNIFWVLIVACLLNPMGIQGAWYPIKILIQLPHESKIFFAKILELQRPINWHVPWALTPYPHYKILIIISFLSFVVNRRKINLDLLLLWIFFLVFSLSAIRNLVYFSFMAYFVFFVNFSNFSGEHIPLVKAFSVKMRHMLSLVVKVMIIFYLVDFGTRLSYNGYYDFDTYQRKSEFGGVSLRNFPYQAADFLIKNDIKGNFFNDFNSGAYLAGRCFPNIKVFIDGRTELYGAEFFQTHDQAWKGDKQLLDELIERYKISGLFLNSAMAPIPQKLLWHISKDKKWELVYLDYDAVIFLRVIPQNAEFIRKYKIDLARWKTKKMDLKRLGLTNVKPYQNVHRAYSLIAMDFHDAALKEAYAAVKIMPNYAEPHKIIGGIFLKKGLSKKAFEALRVARILDPRNPEVRYQLALFFEEQNDFKQALEQCQIAVAYKPGYPSSLLALVRIQAKQGQDKEAVETLKSIKGMSAFESSDLLSVGDVFYNNKKYTLAKEAYVMGLSFDPENQNFKLRLDELNKMEDKHE